MESPAVRRRTVQAVKSKNTVVEMGVRRMLYAQGYRIASQQRCGSDYESTPIAPTLGPATAVGCYRRPPLPRNQSESPLDP